MTYLFWALTYIATLEIGVLIGFLLTKRMLEKEALRREAEDGMRRARGQKAFMDHIERGETPLTYVWPWMAPQAPVKTSGAS